MSKLNPLYEKWDVKYFRKEHIKRMELIWEQPTSYQAFHTRLKSGMSLREAIYTPSNTNMKRNRVQMPKPNKLKNLRFRFISFFKH